MNVNDEQAKISLQCFLLGFFFAIFIIIVIGVIGAFIPHLLLGPRVKAKESEIKTAVGTTMRSQIAYHSELLEFADNMCKLGLENITAGADFVDNIAIKGGGPNSSFTTVISYNAESKIDGTRAYSGAVEYNSGDYITILCQTDSVVSTGIAPTDVSKCPYGTTEIK